MLRIRFQRRGKRNRPFFSIVVIERSAPPQGGRPVDIVGWFDPITKEFDLKKEKVLEWLQKGAQPSERVYNLLVKIGVLRGKKKPVHATKPGTETGHPSEEGLPQGEDTPSSGDLSKEDSSGRAEEG